MPRDPFEKKYDPVMFKAFDALRKVAKSTWNAMGETLREIKASTSLLAAFGSEALIAKVYNKVIGNYTKFLSDTFWSEIVKGIDFSLMTTAVTDILAPVFSGIGEWIGDRIEEAPIGTAIGASLGSLIGSFAGLTSIGAAIGGALGYLIEEAPIGGTIGTIIGGAVGGVIGGPFGALIAAPIGAALGALIESLITDTADIISRGFTYEPVPGTQADMIRLMGLYHANFLQTGDVMTLREWYWDVYVPSLGGDGDGAGTRFDKLNPDDFMDRYGSLKAFQSGTPYVPESGIYHLTQGEAVIPAGRNRSGSEIHVHIDLRNAVVDNIDRLSQKIVEQVMIQLG